MKAYVVQMANGLCLIGGMGLGWRCMDWVSAVDDWIGSEKGLGRVGVYC